jgi:hypothetical protein
VLVSAFVSWRLAGAPAYAKYSYELSESPTLSIRPGMSSRQVQQLEVTGELPPLAPSTTSDDATEGATADAATEPSSSSSSASLKKQSKANAVKKSKKDSVYGEYYDEDDDLELLDEDAAIGTLGATSLSAASASGGAGSQRDKVAAARLAASTKSTFAARHRGKSTALTAKVSAALFVPTFGGMFIREFLRRGREEEYVRKGLEILEAQKAEYFNVTATSSDSDVQDALKGLKNKNQTKAGSDDDDDDDDDDEDDKPQPKMRRSPRTPPPKGDGGGGAGSGPQSGAGGKSDDPGYGRPSDEDIDKLNRLLGRS